MEGTPFGHYRLLDLLGRGGMGEVWRAYDTETSRVVALKVLPAELAADETFQQRFRREAHAAAGLNEPHVVPIHRFGEIAGRLYVDMRLVVGRDLQAVLADGPLDPVRAVNIVEQIAAALHAAHQVGLVHRDVKPSNILVADRDFSYLIDFGIARAAGDTALTGTGSTIGTFAYMAPERISSGRTDPSADVYALACVLYECLTGARPFPGDGFEQLAAAHLWTPPPLPSATARGVGPRFDAVISTGMAKDPHQRYRSTLALAESARAALATVPIVPRDSPRYTQALQPPPTVAAGAPFHQAGPPHRTGPEPGARSGGGRWGVWVGVAAAVVGVVAVVLVMTLGRTGGVGDTTTRASQTSAAGTTQPGGPVMNSSLFVINITDADVDTFHTYETAKQGPQVDRICPDKPFNVVNSSSRRIFLRLDLDTSDVREDIGPIEPDGFREVGPYAEGLGIGFFLVDARTDNVLHYVGIEDPASC